MRTTSDCTAAVCFSTRHCLAPARMVQLPRPDKRVYSPRIQTQYGVTPPCFRQLSRLRRCASKNWTFLRSYARLTICTSTTHCRRLLSRLGDRLDLRHHRDLSHGE